MKTSSRIAAACALAGTAVLALSAPAFAHVTVQPEGEAAKGGYAVVDFRVPNESDKASTVKLEVSFPMDTPLASAMPEPIAGWTAKVTKAELDKPIELHGQEINEAVSKITWTATGKGVEPGFFQKFPVSMGALPEDADELVFKAVQTYDDGEVARWIEVQQEGQEEPEKPAPVLTLSEASEDGHSHGSESSEEASEEPSDDASQAAATTTADDADSDSSDTTARVLGVVGIVVGAIGVAYGVLAGRRRTNA
ncbi:YcnI family protein [Streptomyces sp. NBC_00287]|uniref:YcnI family copper-binding membrane protein n=1 Tax=Streptomyces sp. NBC_00287 TaxID=2975702 RepID=UPI002E2AE842|nr:YcnI family protein [Streptomyces sp. NBC_00287]